MTYQPKSVACPLLFTYKGPVFGNGFLSYVELCGKLLASLETEGVWLDGVNPGGFAVGAKTLDEANRELRDELTRVLIDFAETSDSFAGFKAAVEQFYSETDAETVQEWDAAIEAVRRGLVPVPGDLPRKPAGWDCFVRATEKSLHDVTPRDNPPLRGAVDTLLAAVA